LDDCKDQHCAGDNGERVAVGLCQETLGLAKADRPKRVGSSSSGDGRRRRTTLELRSSATVKAYSTPANTRRGTVTFL